jgi:hypothetical protein
MKDSIFYLKQSGTSVGGPLGAARIKDEMINVRIAFPQSTMVIATAYLQRP